LQEGGVARGVDLSAPGKNKLIIMFSGIIEEIGTVKKIVPKNNNISIEIAVPFTSELKLGDSVAVNGACLTVTKLTDHTFSAFVSPETINKTNLKNLRSNTRVNLERALPINGRLDGHLVQGHVDFTAKLQVIRPLNEAREIELHCPPSWEPFLVAKGSIALNGISLTINEVLAPSIRLMVIPFTWEHTNLQFAHEQDLINIEIDIFAKYAYKFLRPYQKQKNVDNSILQKLKDYNYL
jgi:riboflavin synthase